MKDVPFFQLFQRDFEKGLCQPHILNTAFLFSIALPPFYTQDGYDNFLSHVGPEAAFSYAPAGQL